MIVYFLIVIILVSITLVKGNESSLISDKDKNNKMKENKINVVTTELLTDLNERLDERSERRNLSWSCGHLDTPNAGKAPNACCYCISDGCGSTGAICCNRHCYANCVQGDCGCCQDLGINANTTAQSWPKKGVTEVFKAIYAGAR